MTDFVALANTAVSQKKSIVVEFEEVPGVRVVFIPSIVQSRSTASNPEIINTVSELMDQGMTIREISKALGFKSHSTAYYYMQKIRKAQKQKQEVKEEVIARIDGDGVEPDKEE